MKQIVLIGLGAGAAAALLLASVVSGSPAAIFLFYLAPLPILITALGWSHLAGLIAASVVSVVIGFLSGPFFLSVLVIAFGAWWLGYLALLARPIANNGGGLQWYPVGRLVLWTAVLGSLFVAVAIPNFGTDQETLQASLSNIFARMLRDQMVIDRLVWAFPPAFAVFSTIINVINIWLAARIVKVSGRLQRPWPDLAMLTLPSSAPALLAASVVGAFLPDLIGIFSRLFAASLLMAFALQGFAVLHAVTRGMDSRYFLLAAAYVASFVVIYLLLAVVLLGLAEAFFNIRARVARRRGPPTLTT
jgi:hypothetical protein